MKAGVREGLRWSLYLGVGALLAWAGYALMFSVFMVYDDEGYVLLTLRNAFSAGSLYNEVYTQYGPFFYLSHKAVAALGGWEWTQTFGRFITLAYWLGMAGLCASMTWKLTRSAVGVVTTMACTFSYLWIMTNEPMHPGGMIGFMVALSGWIGLHRDPARYPASAAAIAAIGTMMVFSKINTGVFLLTALWGWLALAGRATTSGRVIARWTGVLLLSAPFVIMHKLIAEPWVQIFIVVVTIAHASIWSLGWRNLPTVPSMAKGWIHATLAGLITTVLIIVPTLVLGTTWDALLDGVLLGPLKHPAVYSFPVNWRPLTFVALLLAIFVGWGAWRWPQSKTLLRVIHVVRFALAVLVVASGLNLLPMVMSAVGFSIGLPLLVVVAVPLSTEPAARGRLWLAMLMTWQSLHAFPVAGSQLNWGTFLWVPLLIASLHESLQMLPVGRARQVLNGVTATVGMGLAFILMFGFGQRGLRDRLDGEALGLNGAEDLVVPSSVTVPIRIMTLNAAHHVDPLFTLPGIFSFNMWSGVRTPTLNNATHWFSLLSAEQQGEIITRLEESPRAGVIVQLDLLRYLLSENIVMDGPLLDYLVGHFGAVLEVDGYALWLKKGREVPLLGIAQWEPARRELRFNRSEAPPRLNAVEFWVYDGNNRRLIHRASSETFELNASPRTDEPGLWACVVRCDPNTPPVDGLLVLRDENDAIVQILRLRP